MQYLHIWNKNVHYWPEPCFYELYCYNYELPVSTSSIVVTYKISNWWISMTKKLFTHKYYFIKIEDAKNVEFRRFHPADGASQLILIYFYLSGSRESPWDTKASRPSCLKSAIYNGVKSEVNKEFSPKISQLILKINASARLVSHSVHKICHLQLRQIL